MMNQSRLTIAATLILGLARVHTPAVAATITVHNGESIQTAVTNAAPGDTVVVESGSYQEGVEGGTAVTIDKSLTLVASTSLADPEANPTVILEAKPRQTQGIYVSPPQGDEPMYGDIANYINNVTIKGFTVRNFQNNGIYLQYVNNYWIEHNRSENNQENGIFPTLSANGTVRKNVAYGSADSALWVEASENVRVIDNELFNSPTGLEVTISKNVEMTGNLVHDNVTGVGLYHPSAAGLGAKSPTGDDWPTGDWRLVNNQIYNNNLENTAPSGSMPAALPSGGGVLVLGVDRVQVVRNKIENNDFYGIAVIDWCTAVASTAMAGPAAIGGQSFDCISSPPAVEPYPDNNMFGRNILNDNGLNPPPVQDQPFALFASDLTDFVMTMPPDTSLPGDHFNLFCANTSDTREFPTRKFPEKPLGQPIELSDWCPGL